MKLPSQIIPGLFLGNDKNSEVDSYGYTMIVNCTPHLPFCISVPDPTDLKRISIKDDPYDSVILFNILKDTDILETMHFHLRQNRNILVHCQAGAQRSPTVVACYLMKYHGLSGEEAIQYIRSKRLEAFFCMVNFENTIELFGEYLNLRKNK